MTDPISEAIKALEYARSSVDSALAELRVRTNRRVSVGPLDMALRVVEDEFELPSSLIMGKRRVELVLWPRQIVNWLMVKRYKYSYESTGMLCQRNHGTIINSVKSVEASIETNPRRREQVERIINRLNEMERQNEEAKATQSERPDSGSTHGTPQPLGRNAEPGVMVRLVQRA